MRSAEITVARRILAVLEPGDDVLTSIAAICTEHRITSAVIPAFLGAFTEVTLIGTDQPVADHDAPMPQSTTVRWVEGVGTATVAPDEQGRPVVHLHAAVGVKADAALGYAGHVLSARTHYTAELVIEEITGPTLRRRPDPAAHGIATLHL